MNWEALGAIAETLGAVGVIATLAYLAYQVRENTQAVSAQSRHSISEFVLQVALFRAEHADRYAKLKSTEELTEEDREFRMELGPAFSRNFRNWMDDRLRAQGVIGAKDDDEGQTEDQKHEPPF